MSSATLATAAQLQTLVAVAEAGSVGGAALRLGRTQSAVSHSLAELERRMRLQLVVRDHRGARLTPAGRRALARARDVLVLLESLPDDARAGDELVGRVRLATFRSVATHLLPTVHGALARLHPGVELEVDDGCHERGDVEERLLSGAADLAVAHLPVSDVLIARPLLADPYVLVAPADWSISDPVRWSEVDGRPYLELACSGARSVVERCRAAGLTAPVAMRLVEDSTVLAMVADGHGFSILPRLATHPPSPRIRVAALPVPAQRSLGVVSRPSRTFIPAVRGVRELLLDAELLRAVPVVAERVVEPAPHDFAPSRVSLPAGSTEIPTTGP